MQLQCKKQVLFVLYWWNMASDSKTYVTRWKAKNIQDNIEESDDILNRITTYSKVAEIR